MGVKVHSEEKCCGTQLGLRNLPLMDCIYGRCQYTIRNRKVVDVKICYALRAQILQ